MADTAERAATIIDGALKETTNFDESIGLSENAKKRQRWKKGHRVEHLGLQLLPAGVEDDLPASLPAPRDGWEPIEDAMKRVFVIPGTIAVREMLMAVCVMPKFSWAAPLMQPPPEALNFVAFRTLVGGGKWWCIARYFADNIHLHPKLALAIQSLKRGANLAKSTTMSLALKTHADVLNLQVVSHDEELLVQPGPGATKSVRTAFKASCEEGFSTVDPRRRKASISSE